ncbi:hypothetical protein F4860DRAFT_460835 [Xylaria cubensis]|nr:hypothetical protein F4860DRAFT_460835 [Xylaria cubensis]
MKLARCLQTAFHTKRLQVQHPARSISYITRNLTSSTTIIQPRRPLVQSSLPLSKLFIFTRSPYSTSANSSSSHPPSSPIMDTTETKSETNNGTQPESETSSSSAPLPALPAADGATSTLEVGGAALRLDHLGPLVVNEDGTLSRIANWEKMADIERENTLRILGKRNQVRLAKLRAAKESGNSENVSEKVTESK